MTDSAPHNVAPRSEEAAALDALLADFARHHMNPLWTQTGDLMPVHPRPRAVAHVWRWSVLLPLAQRAGALVPVGRGGERRAIGLANPGLGGAPYVSPTLWAAIQYLGPHEIAPEHRHAQNAFRFVLEGDGVWTVVDGDPVRMSRGDLLLTPGWCFHGHQNVRDAPMAWLDGLDIPFAQTNDVGFFEAGSDSVSDRSTPDRSRAERLWAHPGLRAVSTVGAAPAASPLCAYRWEATDHALEAQLALETEGAPGVAAPGHAAIRFTNPATGGDALPTIRCEFHRLRAGTRTEPRRQVGARVYQVFDGAGAITLDTDRQWLETGDLVVVPSWVPAQLETETGLDLFAFSDAPIMERLGFMRSEGAPA